jgi:hypothetical protein
VCNCKEKLNARLEADNSVLKEASLINIKTGDVRQSLYIETEKLYSDKKRGKIRKVCLTFCPFCAERYVPKAIAA